MGHKLDERGLLQSASGEMQSWARARPLLGWGVALFTTLGLCFTLLGELSLPLGQKEAFASGGLVSGPIPGGDPLRHEPLAVCVSGTAEFANLTAGALGRHFAGLSSSTKIFVSAMLDEHAAQLAALGGACVAAVRLVSDIPHLKKARAAVNRTLVLQDEAAAESAEGIAARLYLAEQCAAMVQRYEEAQGMKFKWVANGDLGQLWGPPSGTPFPLVEQAYTSPALACGWGGVSPLFGVGGRDIGLAAAAGRLGHLFSQGSAKRMTLDALYRLFLHSKEVRVEYANFPFCTLTPPPAAAAAAPVHAVGSAGAVNGAPCWPCDAEGFDGALEGSAAWEALTAGPAKWGVALPPPGSALRLCAGDGAAAVAAEKVKKEECLRAVGAAVRSVGQWEGGGAAVVCARAHLGPMSLLGTEYGGWTLFPSVLNSQSIVYSFGVGKDISWDLSIIKTFSLHVHAFDNTPISMGWLAKQSPPARWHHHPFLLGAKDGDLKLALPKGHGISFATIEANAKGFNDKTFITLPARTLATLMQDNGHTKIDVLKVDIEGAEFAIIEKWAAAKQPPVACQLLIEFHGRLMADGARRREAAVRALEGLGFLLGHSNVDDFGSDDCLFYSPEQCFTS